MTTNAPPSARPTRFSCVRPNWSATVMGTAIVATASTVLPVAHPVLTAFAVVVWAVSVALLAAVGLATAAHHHGHPVVARGWVGDPVMSHFHGATAMAPMAVGAATLTAGHHVVGDRVALEVALGLWVVGTALGTWTALSARIRAARAAGSAEAYWLMPVVPPMVSAALGGLVAGHLAVGPVRTALLVAAWACFALAVVLSAPLVAAVVRRVASGDVPAATPTLFIVLGPLGQSATAALLLAAAGPGWLVGPAHAWAVGVTGLALAWLVVATVVVVRTRPGFAMTWWSFTFPVGTVVTGTAGLAAAGGATAVVAAPLALLLYAGLVAAWAVVAARTVVGVADTTLLR